MTFHIFYNYSISIVALIFENVFLVGKNDIMKNEEMDRWKKEGGKNDFFYMNDIIGRCGKRVESMSRVGEMVRKKA